MTVFKVQCPTCRSDDPTIHRAYQCGHSDCPCTGCSWHECEDSWHDEGAVVDAPKEKRNGMVQDVDSSTAGVRHLGGDPANCGQSRPLVGNSQADGASGGTMSEPTPPKSSRAAILKQVFDEDQAQRTELAALRLRVEELTKWKQENVGKVCEYDEATKLVTGNFPDELGGAELPLADRITRRVEELKEWLTTSEELGEARQAPKIELEQETDGRWLAEYKEIPGMMVYGATIGEALRKLADLIEQSEERA